MPTLPGLMRYLARARGAVGIFRQQQVAVVVEVADDGHAQALRREPVDDLGTAAAASSLLTVTRTSSEAGAGQRGDLPDGAVDVRGVGVGHGLHHNRCIAAHADAADGGGKRLSALNFGHVQSLF